MGVPWAWEESFPQSLFDLDRSDLREVSGGAGPSLSLSIAESPSLRTIAKFLVETDEAPRSSNNFAGGSSLSGSLYFPPDLEPVPTRVLAQPGAQPMLMEWMNNIHIALCISSGPILPSLVSPTCFTLQPSPGLPHLLPPSLSPVFLPKSLDPPSHEGETEAHFGRYRPRRAPDKTQY